MVLQKEINTLFIRLTSFISILILFLLAAQLNAQARDISRPPTNTKEGFDWDRVVVGGNFGAQFGNITLVNLSPSIGYQIKDFWLAGISTRYIYFSDNRFTPAFNTSVYGGGPFTQFFFLENFLAHSEYEFLNVEQFDSPNERLFIQSWLVGGGYRSQIGGNSFAGFIILWDLIQDINSPYTNPIFRVNLGFGL